MKFIISSIGKFHSYSVAKELFARNKLEKFITGHPRFKIDKQYIGKENLVFIDFMQTINLISKKYMFLEQLNKELNWISHNNFDTKSKKYLRKFKKNNNIDKDKYVFLSLSGSGLYSGRYLREEGIIHFCDVGSTHIKEQNITLANEFKKLNISYQGTDERLIEKECIEFDEANKIIVPSEFVKKTFLKMGINENKIIKIPYGSDTTYFEHTNNRNFSSNNLILTFAGELSIRKGIHYLLEYFSNLPNILKSRLKLNLYGSYRGETKYILSKYNNENITIKNSIPQKQLSLEFNKSDIYVILSIEEGLSLTIPQAMSVGCIVIATPNTGAEELIINNINGFIINHDFNEFLEIISNLLDDNNLRERISVNAINSMKQNCGFKNYVDRLIECVE